MYAAQGPKNAMLNTNTKSVLKTPVMQLPSHNPVIQQPISVQEIIAKGSHANKELKSVVPPYIETYGFEDTKFPPQETYGFEGKEFPRKETEIYGFKGAEFIA